MTAQDQPDRDHDCSPRDSVDALLASWARRRPDLDFGPVGVITRLARVRGHVDAGLEQVFRAFGLSPADFAALVTLARIGEPHGTSQHELAGELGLTPGTVSVRVDRLVAQGLAVRQADPDSKRSTLVALTPAGRELFERAAPAHLANSGRLLAALSGPERRLLAGLLRKLLVEFEGARPDAPGHGPLGLVVFPAHVTIGMRAAVGLPRVAGLLVRSVAPGSPAARAGLRPGDVLIEAGGREIRSSAALYAAVRDAGTEPVALTVLRGQDRVPAVLSADPGRPADASAVGSHGPRPRAEHTL